jgi:hypothetical protein
MEMAVGAAEAVRLGGTRHRQAAWGFAGWDILN